MAPVLLGGELVFVAEPGVSAQAECIGSQHGSRAKVTTSPGYGLSSAERMEAKHERSYHLKGEVFR